ncbi:MAG: DegV family protein [Dehalococcoidia bacterium]|nr:DegV family protein [Dehalococcoidia bacterium]
MAVKIVTDSTCDLPQDLVQKFAITVVPLFVRFGAQTYRDGVDLSADEFYRKLTGGGVLPTTAAPPPGAFAEIYQKYLAEGHQVLSLHVSSKLSATYSAALNGKDQIGAGSAVDVVDTLTVTLGLGLLVLEAGRAAQAGGQMADVAGLIRRRMPDLKLYGAFDTLEYLHKGGRIGKASAMLGALLNLKPMVVVRDGEVHPLERVRTRAKAVNRLIELATAAKTDEVAIMHSTTPVDRDDLAKRIDAIVPGRSQVKAQFGPVLGTYTGPGILGVAFIENR